MEPSSKQTLVQVVDLIKQGENHTAVRLLSDLLGKEPKLEQAWYLLGVALENPERKRFAFQHVLKLNPDNQRAKQQLEKMGDEPALPSPPPAVVEEPPVPSPPPPAEEPPAPSQDVRTPTPTQTLRDRLAWLEPAPSGAEEPPEPPSPAEFEAPKVDQQPETPAWAARKEPLAEEQAPESPSWTAPETPEADEQPETPAWAAFETPHAEEPSESPSWMEFDETDQAPEPPSWAAPESPMADEPTEPAPWTSPDAFPGGEIPEPPQWEAPESPQADEPTEPAPWDITGASFDDKELDALSWLEPEAPSIDQPLDTSSWLTPEAPPEGSPGDDAPWLASDSFDESKEIELPSWAQDLPDTLPESSGQPDQEPEMPSWAQNIERSSVDPFTEEPRDIPAFSFELAEDEPEPAPKREPIFQPEPKEEPEEPEKKKKRKSRKERKAEKLAAKQEEEEQKTEKSLQEELLGDEDTRKRRRINWRPRRGLIVFLIWIIILGSLGGGAYYYRDTLIPIVTEIAPTVVAFVLQQPTPTPDYTATPTPTPVIPPTLAPTWTPGSGAVGLVADTPTPGVPTTPTVTPTPLPLQASVVEEMEKIEEEFREIRELEASFGVDREMMPRSKFEPFMRAVAGDTIDQQEQIQQLIVYRALGFVADDYDPVEVAMNDLADFVGGYYNPDQNKIFLTGTGFYGLEQFIYSYEFGFALLSDYYDVHPDTCQGSRDACWAENALITGDVLLAQQRWLQTYPIQFNPDTYFDLDDPDPVFADPSTPPYFNASRNFAVLYGLPFVSHLYNDQGWQTVNSTYQFTPETSEQVIHPEKFDAREPRILVYDPDLLPRLGQGWELVERDALGEWGTYLLLSAPDYPDAVRQEEDAAAAAAGWGGDNCQVYYHPENNTIVMSVHWNWDTAEDQEEFLAEFEESQAGRFEDSEFAGPDEGTCWMLDDEYSCIYQTAQDVLWLFSNDLTALEAAKTAFTQFP